MSLYARLQVFISSGPVTICDTLVNRHGQTKRHTDAVRTAYMMSSAALQPAELKRETRLSCFTASLWHSTLCTSAGSQPEVGHGHVAPIHFRCNLERTAALGGQIESKSSMGEGSEGAWSRQHVPV